MSERRSRPSDMLWHIRVWTASSCLEAIAMLTQLLYYKRKEGIFQKPWLYLVTKFSEPQFTLRSPKNRKSPDFCHRRLEKPGDINKFQTPGQTTVIFLIHCPTERICWSVSFLLSDSSPVHLWSAAGEWGKEKGVEASRNYSSNSALAGICKLPLSR